MMITMKQDQGRAAAIRVYTSGEVAQILGITKAQLFYWEETHKIPKASRTGSGKRYYLPQDIENLKKLLTRKASKTQNEYAAD